MICPRCGAYTSDLLDKCTACDAEFDRDARQTGEAIQESTGLASDSWGVLGYKSPPTSKNLIPGALVCLLVLVIGIWLGLGDPYMAPLGYGIAGLAIVGLVMLVIGGVGTALYEFLRK